MEWTKGEKSSLRGDFRPAQPTLTSVGRKSIRVGGLLQEALNVWGKALSWLVLIPMAPSIAAAPESQKVRIATIPDGNWYLAFVLVLRRSVVARNAECWKESTQRRQVCCVIPSGDRERAQAPVRVSNLWAGSFRGRGRIPSNKPLEPQPPHIQPLPWRSCP